MIRQQKLRKGKVKKPFPVSPLFPRIYTKKHYDEVLPTLCPIAGMHTCKNEVKKKVTHFVQFTSESLALLCHNIVLSSPSVLTENPSGNLSQSSNLTPPPSE